MSFFSKKILHPENTYVVLPNSGAIEARQKALEKKKHLSKLNLKKDLEQFIRKHYHESLDKRQFSASRLLGDLKGYKQ